MELRLLVISDELVYYLERICVVLELTKFAAIDVKWDHRRVKFSQALLRQFLDKLLAELCLTSGRRSCDYEELSFIDKGY